MTTTGRIRTLIADDEPISRTGLRRLLGQDHDLQVLEAKNGAETIDELARRNVDLLFLDVEMPDVNGLQCLAAVDGARPVVVFVTAYEQYALRAFEVQALDYLLKPFSDQRLALVLERAKHAVWQRRGPSTSHGGFVSRLVIRGRNGVALVSTTDVDWIEARGYTCRVHVGGRAYKLRESLQHLEQRLDPARFVRIHRSAIVQIDRIRELERYYRDSFAVILVDGTRLLLSRRRRAALELTLGQCL